MFGAISEKFRTFDKQINFAIPPISHFRRWLGEFFSLFQSYEISITLSISSLGKSKTFWTFPDSPYHTRFHISQGRLGVLSINDWYTVFERLQHPILSRTASIYRV